MNLNQLDYLPFGKVYTVVNNTTDNELGFPGQILDAEYVNQTPLNMVDPFGLDTICGSGAVWIRDSSRNGGGYCKPTRDQGPQCPFGDCAAFPDSMEDACVQACIAEKLPDCVPTSPTQADAVESFACASAVIISCGQKTCDKCENQ